MSGLGSSPAVRITDRMFLAPSMSLHKDKDSRLDHRYRSVIRKVYKKKNKKLQHIHPARECPVTKELKTASVMGRSLVFMKPSMVLHIQRKWSEAEHPLHRQVASVHYHKLIVVQGPHFLTSLPPCLQFDNRLLSVSDR